MDFTPDAQLEAREFENHQNGALSPKTPFAKLPGWSIL
jgi:hypothetical protein